MYRHRVATLRPFSESASPRVRPAQGSRGSCTDDDLDHAAHEAAVLRYGQTGGRELLMKHRAGGETCEAAGDVGIDPGITMDDQAPQGTPEEQEQVVDLLKLEGQKTLSKN